MRSSHKSFPSGATHGLPSDKLWVRSISMPTIVSICSSPVNRSINSWTGTLPLGSRKYSIRHSTTVTVQDISCYLKLKLPGFQIPETLPRTRHRRRHPLSKIMQADPVQLDTALTIPPNVLARPLNETLPQSKSFRQALGSLSPSFLACQFGLENTYGTVFA